MSTPATPVPTVPWDIDDAAPTWVRCAPLPSDLEATRVWRDESPDPPPIERTLVFPLARRITPESSARLRARGTWSLPAFVAAFCGTGLLLAVATGWVMIRL